MYVPHYNNKLTVDKNSMNDCSHYLLVGILKTIMIHFHIFQGLQYKKYTCILLK